MMNHPTHFGEKTELLLKISILEDKLAESQCKLSKYEYNAPKPPQKLISHVYYIDKFDIIDNNSYIIENASQHKDVLFQIGDITFEIYKNEEQSACKLCVIYPKNNDYIQYLKFIMYGDYPIRGYFIKYCKDITELNDTIKLLFKMVEFYKKIWVQIKENNILGFEKTLLLHYELLSCSLLTGNTAEIGVFEGNTSKMIKLLTPEKIHYCYETFYGIIGAENDRGYKHKNGDFSCSLKKYIEIVNMDNVVYKKGLLQNTFKEENETFCFVYCDTSTYTGTIYTLNSFKNNIVIDGKIVIYYDNNCNGACKAIDDFLEHNWDFERTNIYGSSFNGNSYLCVLMKCHILVQIEKHVINILEEMAKHISIIDGYSDFPDYELEEMLEKHNTEESQYLDGINRPTEDDVKQLIKYNHVKHTLNRLLSIQNQETPMGQEEYYGDFEHPTLFEDRQQQELHLIKTELNEILNIDIELHKILFIYHKK